MIYIDTLNHVITQYTKLDTIMEDDFQRKIFEENKAVLATESSLIILESYIDQIALYPHLVAGRIIAFYGALRHIDEAVNILNKGINTYTNETKKFWLDFITDKIYSSISKGKWVMSHFENRYDIGRIIQNLAAKEEYNQLHKKIIKKRPEIKDKLVIKE